MSKEKFRKFVVNVDKDKTKENMERLSRKKKWNSVVEYQLKFHKLFPQHNMMI